MALMRPVKTKKVAARLTERQHKKLETLAVVNETTYSGVLCALLDKVTLDPALVGEIRGLQQNDYILA